MRFKRVSLIEVENIQSSDIHLLYQKMNKFVQKFPKNQEQLTSPASSASVSTFLRFFGVLCTVMTSFRFTETYCPVVGFKPLFGARQILWSAESAEPARKLTENWGWPNWWQKGSLTKNYCMLIFKETHWVTSQFKWSLGSYKFNPQTDYGRVNSID